MKKINTKNIKEEKIIVYFILNKPLFTKGFNELLLSIYLSFFLSINLYICMYVCMYVCILIIYLLFTKTIYLMFTWTWLNVNLMD
jgi:hypothetical protein